MDSSGFGQPVKFETVSVGSLVRCPMWPGETFRVGVKASGRIILECQSPISGNRGYSAAKFDRMGYILVPPGGESSADSIVH
jgi:hypothetical protein